ncbi:MAG: DJ-1/PfpI family protein [Candidatus Pacebacteria bacterium]|nr:DJ-1/PfpI family protein [Candidatus Paceibacterota bacterium]
MNKHSAAVLLAPGFEETEAVTVIDVLRRANVRVILVSLHADLEVTGAHDIVVKADVPLASLDSRTVELAVVPGGMPGAENLAASPLVTAFLNDVYGNGGWVAALCAAPIVLHAAGLLTGRRVTSYPGFECHLTGAQYTGERVEQDDRIITSQGPGTALQFALYVVKTVVGSDTCKKLAAAMMYSGPDV